MGKRLCNGDSAFLPMLLVSCVKDQPKSLLVDGQCLDRILFCLKPFDFNDFSLKQTKYSLLPMVPQLSKCLKFEAIRGDQTDQRICI